MKIGAKVNIFNWRMRERRNEMGFTQKEFAEYAGIGLGCVQYAETLKPIAGNWPEKLRKIAIALELQFDELFPDDYIEHMRTITASPLLRSLGLKSRLPIVKEVNLNRLMVDGIESLQLPSPEEIILIEEREKGLPKALNDVLESLTEREGDILKLHFGIGNDDGKVLTFSEIAEKYGVTKERIRQLENDTLRKIRHPSNSGELRNWRYR